MGLSHIGFGTCVSLPDPAPGPGQRPLTLTTIVSHLALYFVLVLSLRHVGVSEQEISWAEILVVFSFGRLITALLITPGGVGLIEAAYIAALVAIGKNHRDVSLDVFTVGLKKGRWVFEVLPGGNGTSGTLEFRTFTVQAFTGG